MTNFRIRGQHELFFSFVNKLLIIIAEVLHDTDLGLVYFMEIQFVTDVLKNRMGVFM